MIRYTIVDKARWILETAIHHEINEDMRAVIESVKDGDIIEADRLVQNFIVIDTWSYSAEGLELLIDKVTLKDVDVLSTLLHAYRSNVLLGDEELALLNDGKQLRDKLQRIAEEKDE